MNSKYKLEAMITLVAAVISIILGIIFFVVYGKFIETFLCLLTTFILFIYIKLVIIMHKLDKLNKEENKNE